MDRINNILDYIPQRPPFVMIDALIEINNQSTVSSFKIADDNLFVENGEFFEGGIIENMAQSVAAGAGYRLRYDENSDPKIGVIGTIKNLFIHKRPAVRNSIQTTIDMISSYENAMVVQCTVRENGITIAGCQMNIFVIENPNNL